jgi:hypothetical protein
MQCNGLLARQLLGPPGAKGGEVSEYLGRRHREFNNASMTGHQARIAHVKYGAATAAGHSADSGTLASADGSTRRVFTSVNLCEDASRPDIIKLGLVH